MAIKNGRTAEAAQVIINHDECTQCGLCVKVCCGNTLYMAGGQVQFDQNRLFGCLACGQCMAVCPQGCITVEGRCMSAADRIALPDPADRAAYCQLHALMLSRRSIRRFDDREVDQEAIDKILAAASTAPIGIPPSDVSILVLKGRDKVQQFAADFLDYACSRKKMISAPVLAVMRPFIGKELAEFLKNFFVPLLDFLTESRRKGEDMLFFNAPLVMLFQGTPYGEGNALIAATYAVLAAESLGLGSCMIGTVAPMIKSSKRIKEKYKMAPGSQGGIAVVFGYPAVKYQHAIRRSFAEVVYY